LYLPVWPVSEICWYTGYRVMCYSSSQNIVTLTGNRNMLNIYDVMNAA